MDQGEGIQGEVLYPDIDRVIEDSAPAVGFGLFLMRKLADRVEFDRNSRGGHRVRLAIGMQPRTPDLHAAAAVAAGNR
jgi:anti-sigma regulatory factor (Ser/Thr protein kinase)